MKLLLEADALILRGAIRRHFARSRLESLRVDSGLLRFDCGGESVALHLGESAVAKWMAAIQQVPPSLREKLGLARDRAYWVGPPATEPELIAAIDGACTAFPDEAAVLLGVVEQPADLDALIAAQPLPTRLPLWAIYPKGKAVPFGDAAVRVALREAGYRDTKSCAVSARLTATRYHPRD
ncbi:hypothetical protein ABIC65_002233 [Sphingomonas trueperi]|uniref:hypothetical protein n=1 Tax=Sphingomonas trueperi TaxID=53317 RepID=UPI00339301D3